MLDNHCTTWCENPDNPRSECHGWSSVPLYEFSANILGVKYDVKDEIVIQPHFGELSYARGAVPTRFGMVTVEWEKKDAMYQINVDAPDTVLKKIILPIGQEMAFSTRQKCLSVIQ